MSSIAEDLGDDDDENGGEQVSEVMHLARSHQTRTSAEGVELLEEGTQGYPNTAVKEKHSAEESAAPSAAFAVFSTHTLTLTLEDILLNPAYVQQMESLAQHLIGEFNVEGLLFFFRVLNFQKFVERSKKAASMATDLESGESDVATDVAPSDESGELSNFSSSSAASERQTKDVAGHMTTSLDAEIAWKAMLIFFEFLDRDAPAQVRASRVIAVLHCLSDVRFLKQSLDRYLTTFRDHEM